MDKKHQGAFSEHMAICWLLNAGYEVFRNISQHGPVDLIARDPGSGDLTQIDVKTASVYLKQDGTLSYHSNGPSAVPGIRVLLYVKDENRFIWQD